MKRSAFLVAIMILSFWTVPVLAQKASATNPLEIVAATAKSSSLSPTEVSHESSADLAAIRATSQQFVKAFNKGDAKAIAALWCKDGDYISGEGQRYDGRKSIEKVYAFFFIENPKARIRILIDSLRLLSDSVAIEDGRAVLEPPPTGEPGFSKYTVVHVKVDGKWLMSTVRDAWIETPSAYRVVTDLEWLIGTWTAEEHGAKSKSVCRWVANKSFVERDYSVTKPDGIVSSGVQLIGWNPEKQCMQSWNFSSDGGIAVGIWSPIAGGWAAEMRGVTGDGVPTTAVNRVMRLDDNAYVWQSVKRTVDGNALPDTDEVVIRRSAQSDL